MQVKTLIESLKSANPKDHVFIGNHDEIMYAVKKIPGAIHLEPKSTMDINAALDEFFKDHKNYFNHDISEISRNDAKLLVDLYDQGYVIDDLKRYNESAYNWANLVFNYSISEFLAYTDFDEN